MIWGMKLMRNFKKQIFGYCSKEVDNYFRELDQEKKRITENKKQALIDETAQIETILEHYKQEEEQVLEKLNKNLADHVMIVQHAKDRKQEMEELALRELQAKKDRLTELEQLLLQVCERLQQLQNDLYVVNHLQKPLLVSPRRLNGEEKKL